MDDFEKQLLEDAEMNTPDEGGLKKLSALATELKNLREQKERLESMIKEVGKTIDNLEQVEIPSKMAELGVAGFTMESGEKVEVKDHIRAAIPEKYREQAFAWLEDNGHGDLIKTEIKCALDRGDVEKASQILAILQEQGVFDAELKKQVHWGTLTSFVKEQLEQGEAIPLEYLGVFQGKKVVIK